MPPPLCDFIIRKKEITFNKLEIVGLFGNIDGYFSRLFLYGEAGGFFAFYRQFLKAKKYF
jgi:hypothetical protein